MNTKGVEDGITDERIERLQRVDHIEGKAKAVSQEVKE